MITVQTIKNLIDRISKLQIFFYNLPDPMTLLVKNKCSLNTFQELVFMSLQEIHNDDYKTTFVLDVIDTDLLDQFIDQCPKTITLEKKYSELGEDFYVITTHLKVFLGLLIVPDLVYHIRLNPPEETPPSYVTDC